MEIGSISIGEGAIGEGGSSAPIILVGTINLAVSTAYAPLVSAGKSIQPGVQTVAVGFNPPSISISATVSIPVLTITAQTWEPKFELITYVPYIFVGVQPQTPKIQTGKSVFPTLTSVAVQTWTPSIRSGVKVGIPELEVHTSTELPIVSIGLVIKAWNVGLQQDSVGSIGSSSIGSLAIGEDFEESKSITFSSLVVSTAYAPLVLAGKNIQVPEVLTTVTTHKPELSARFRRIKVQVISY